MTERNAVKWRNDGDRADPTGALLRALFLATRPTPVGLLPGGLSNVEAAREQADDVTVRRESRLAGRPQNWRGVCRRDVVIRWSEFQDQTAPQSLSFASDPF